LRPLCVLAREAKLQKLLEALFFRYGLQAADDFQVKLDSAVFARGTGPAEDALNYAHDLLDALGRMSKLDGASVQARVALHFGQLSRRSDVHTALVLGVSTPAGCITATEAYVQSLGGTHAGWVATTGVVTGINSSLRSYLYHGNPFEAEPQAAGTHPSSTISAAVATHVAASSSDDEQHLRQAAEQRQDAALLQASGQQRQQQASYSNEQPQQQQQRVSEQSPAVSTRSDTQNQWWQEPQRRQPAWGQQPEAAAAAGDQLPHAGTSEEAANDQYQQAGTSGEPAELEAAHATQAPPQTQRQGWVQACCLPNLAFQDPGMEEDFAQAVAEQCRPVDMFFLAVALVAMPVYFLELLQARHRCLQADTPMQWTVSIAVLALGVVGLGLYALYKATTDPRQYAKLRCRHLASFRLARTLMFTLHSLANPWEQVCEFKEGSWPKLAVINSTLLFSIHSCVSMVFFPYGLAFQACLMVLTVIQAISRCCPADGDTHVWTLHGLKQCNAPQILVLQALLVLVVPAGLAVLCERWARQYYVHKRAEQAEKVKLKERRLKTA
jgi:hypothetical protein